MRKFGKALGRGLLGFVLIGILLWMFGPRESVDTSVTFKADLTAGTLDSYFAAQEAAFSDITPGIEKHVIWAGEPGAISPLSIVYLHGFSATSQEIRPVPDQVAKALGANLILTRLTGHGRGGPAMATATVNDWINDTAEALAAGRAAGKRVVIIATSTGGTLAALAALDPQLSDRVAGIVFVSPNFGIVNRAARILTWPAARWWVPLVAGATRSFDPMNTGQATFWTTRYPTVSVLPMAAMVAHTVAQDYSGSDIPALFLFADADAVVDAKATRNLAARWGGEVTLAPQVLPPGNDPYNHVIAGDILSPGMTDAVVETIINWTQSLKD